jgi:hypothetical protein
MYPTGQELFEATESYMNELNDDNFDRAIDMFEFIHSSSFKYCDILADISLVAINIAALAVSSPDCGVSVKLTRCLRHQ